VPLVGNNQMYRVGVLGPFLDTEIRLGSAATVDSSLLVVIYANDAVDCGRGKAKKEKVIAPWGSRRPSAS
jgi:hypothetical protein